MKIKMGIYGGTNLSAALVTFTASLTRQLISHPELVLINGGYHYKEGFEKRHSADKIVMETAERVLGYPVFNNRFETWLAKDNDRQDVIRFEKGKVVRLPGSTQSRRFNLVSNIDALVTVGGEGNTRSVVELALALNKPVLPVAFTGGDSLTLWQMYKADIIQRLGMSEKLARLLENLPATDRGLHATAKKVADCIHGAVKKTCLVLMPFEKSGNHFYDQYLSAAIEAGNFSGHRIDRNDAAGNIPVLFRTSLEKAGAVVIDVTGFNANVMYELGHLHAKNITPLIVLRIKKGKTNTIGNLPFYLRHEMIVTVADNIEGYKKIQAAVKSFLAPLH